MVERDSPVDPSEGERPPPDAGPSIPRDPDTIDRPVPAQLLGDRYRIESLLGRGGMGEVWRAYDLKLRVDVALKLLLPEVRSDTRRIEMLRREVRTARGVASPHVCRIFDLVEIDGQELIAMEYIDGSTLRDLLATRSPLDLVEARDLALQMLAGLQAIHDAGLVHRDLKPGNVMLTRSGRVMVLDFGLAKGMGETQSLAIAGTPAYMAPEALRGSEVGPRTDLYAAGVMLAEMVHPRGVRGTEELQALWEGLRQQPPKIPAGPWEQSIRRALSAEPTDRFVSAAEMSRSLGEGTSHSGVSEEENPYPGLVAFTEDQARFFFGRELEIESVWKKLRQMSMLAVIGASGVGKSSFLRAGLVPARPEGWRIVRCSPGDSPFTALGQALVPEFTGDTQAMQDLFRLHEIDRSIPLLHGWRSRGTEALLIVDQFEELFTLNPPETQARFAELLGRIAVEADIHVLVSMRDDFFLMCQQYPALRPLFSEPTPLNSLSAADIRRALAQPARLCGYEFESSALLGEMVAEVEDERGALPLVAFAAARLWDRRDREEGILSRRAYEEIGRVGGALAQHAEATLERIGVGREDIVREIFRNLVSAHNTRVVRERSDLLSVFEDRAAAEEVLNQLIDARLLTSFELEPDRPDVGNENDRHRVEIVHESLLSSWPRLVRWQTQDADGAQIRDQLRQAADLWMQRSRSDDVLWSGTAYQEFELWRQRYPGALSDTENAFAEAMEARNRRRKRRRRLAVTGVFLVLLVVLSVVSWLGHRNAQYARVTESRRLMMLGEKMLEEDNTLALALATKSLELVDDPGTRRLALQALSQKPTRFVFELPEPPKNLYSTQLSPDGRWFAVAMDSQAEIHRFDGSEPVVLPMPELSVPHSVIILNVSPDSRYLLGTLFLTEGYDAPKELLAENFEVFVLWSVPGGELVKVWKPTPEMLGLDGTPFFRGFLHPGTLDLILAVRLDYEQPWLWARLPHGGGDAVILGQAETTLERLREFYLDPTGEWLLDWKGPDLFLFPLQNLSPSTSIHVARHDLPVNAATFDREGTLLASVDRSGLIQVWLRSNPGEPVFAHRHDDEKYLRMPVFDHEGSRLAITEGLQAHLAVFDLDDAGAKPMRLGPTPSHVVCFGFSPDGNWIGAQAGASHDMEQGALWFYLTNREYPVVRRVTPNDWELWSAWFQDSDVQIAINREVNEVYLCDLFSDAPECRRIFQNPDKRMLYEPHAVGEEGHFLIGSFPNGAAFLVSPDGADYEVQDGFYDVAHTAVRADGREAVVAGPISMEGGLFWVLRMWDLETGDTRTLKTGSTTPISDLSYLPDGRVVFAGEMGLQICDPTTGEFEMIDERNHLWFKLSPDGRLLLADTVDGPTLWDLEERSERQFPISSEEYGALAVAPNGSFIVVGKIDGDVLYWPLDAEEPFVLLGHETRIMDLKITEDGERIMALAKDGMLRVWPIPTGVPLHTLPHDELLTQLRAQTNLRVVLDAETADGYRIEYNVFDCWYDPPTW